MFYNKGHTVEPTNGKEYKILKEVLTLTYIF